MFELLSVIIQPKTLNQFGTNASKIKFTVMSSSDEDMFDSYIDYDPVESESEPEKLDLPQKEKNTGEKQKTRRFTTFTQMTMLKAFMEGRHVFPRGTMATTPESEKILREWGDLVDRLNGCGPPVRSSSDWRKIWSDYKKRVKFSSSSANVTSLPTTASSVTGPLRNISSTECSNTASGSANVTSKLDGKNSMSLVDSEKSGATVEDDHSYTNSDLSEIKELCKEILKILKESTLVNK